MTQPDLPVHCHAGEPEAALSEWAPRPQALCDITHGIPPPLGRKRYKVHGAAATPGIPVYASRDTGGACPAER